jgi:hypothetical protein
MIMNDDAFLTMIVLVRLIETSVIFKASLYFK